MSNFEHVNVLKNFIERVESATSPEEKSEAVYKAFMWFSELDDVEKSDVFLTMLAQYQD